MMQPTKNKKLTILLICAVAAVWGIIIFRIVFREDSSGSHVIPSKMKIVDEPLDQYFVKEDTVELLLSYRDPFLGHVASGTRERVEQVSQPVAIEVPYVEPVVINWPDIVYAGYINNGNKKVCIVSVNGREQMIAEGETFENVKLVKNSNDSILVEWQGNRKYVKQ